MTPASQQVGSLPHCMRLNQQICFAPICFLHLVQGTAVQMLAYQLKRTSNMGTTGNCISCSVNRFPELRVYYAYMDQSMRQCKLQDAEGFKIMSISMVRDRDKCHNIQHLCSSVQQEWEEDQPLKHQLILEWLEP